MLTPATVFICTIVKAGVVSEAGVVGLQEGWLLLHLFPERQNLSFIELQSLLVNKFHPQFLHQNMVQIQMYVFHGTTTNIIKVFARLLIQTCKDT